MLGFEIFIKEFIQLFLFDQGQGIYLGAEVVGIQYKFNGMVPLLLIRQFIKDSLVKISQNSWYGLDTMSLKCMD